MIARLKQQSTDTSGRMRVKVRKRSANLHVLVMNAGTLQWSREERRVARASLLERLRFAFGKHVIVELDQSAPNEVRCDVIVPRPADPTTVTDRLQRIIEEELHEGEPTRKHIAARLHMSARTLHRRLVDEGTTFRSVLTHVRREIAERHLRERRLAIGEIGFLLGFSEPSAFHRAFKRWTGRPPHAYRLETTGDTTVSEPRQ